TRAASARGCAAPYVKRGTAVLIAAGLAVAPFAADTATSSAAPAPVHGAVGFFLDSTRTQSGPFAVYKVRIDGSGRRQILPRGTQTGGLSPDSKRLYYWELSNGSGHTSIASSD